MSGPGNEEAPYPTSGVDHETAFAAIRLELVDLDASIGSLRDEADRLSESASARTHLAVLDPPADVSMSELEASLEAFGRHAANIPDEFDPAPYDPDEVDTTDESPGAFDALAAAPAFGAAFDVDPKLPPVDVDVKRRSLLEEAPEPPVFGSIGLEDELADPDSGSGATVLEFAPRSTPPDDEVDPLSPPPVTGEAVADKVNAPNSDESGEQERGEAGASTFGAMPDTSSEPPANEDGLDAIAGSESTDVPADWVSGGQGEEAFEKFFSSDVEPEPAQRWLLSE